jgi:hypothetical protein
MRHGQYEQRNEKHFLKTYLDGVLITAQVVVLKVNIVSKIVMEKGAWLEMEMLIFIPVRAQDWEMSRESGRQK